jgi:hypothetical protein
MKQMLFISMVVLTLACGSGSKNRDASLSGNPGSTAQSAGNATDARGREQVVALVGCLQGPALADGATGTSGMRGQTSAQGPGAAPNATASSNARFKLVDASAASPDSGGVGANGAGASGGPLVSGRASYDLDGIPADAVAHVNKQVRVTGRIDPNPATIGGPANTPVNGAPSGAASSGAAEGRASRDDGSAARAANGAAAQPADRRLTVESIQVVSDDCARR